MKATILSLVVGLMISLNAMANPADCALKRMANNAGRFDQKGNYAAQMRNQPQAYNVNYQPSEDARAN